MHAAFQAYVRDLVRELHPAMQVEFLPPRDPIYTDSIYPVRFQAEGAVVTVGFPERMVRFPEGKHDVQDTVARVIRLLPSFQRTSAPSAPPGG